MTDVEDWDDNGWDDQDDDPAEPDWGRDDPPPTGRERRRQARRSRHQRRTWRKIERHANDRSWQARNPTVFDQEAPF